jgi:ribonuclease Y
MDLLTLGVAAAAVLLGLIVGIGVERAADRRRIEGQRSSARAEIESTLDGARKEAETIRRAAALEGKEEGYRLRDEQLEEVEARRSEADKLEKRLADREEAADRKASTLDDRQ